MSSASTGANGASDSVRRWKRLLSRKMHVLLDVVALGVAFAFAYLLRFDFELPRATRASLVVQLPFVVLIQVCSLWLFGVYSLIWRYVGLAELRRFVAAAALGAVPLLVGRALLPDDFGDLRVPVSVTLASGILGFGAVLGLRVLRRIVYERFEKAESARERPRLARKPVLLVGAGRAGVLAVREIFGRGDVGIEVKGFVDDDPQKLGSLIHDVKVLGTSEDIPRLVREHEIDHIVITIAKGSRAEIMRIVEVCERASVKARIIPGLYEILQGRIAVNPIRDIEIEDLLGRDSVRLDESGLSDLLKGATVMVTGAGGSIGSELVRQVARYEPERVLLLERAEPLLFQIEQEMRRTRPDIDVVPLVADVCDVERLRSVFMSYAPHVVLHAAAHKHVPLMEMNPGEAVKNNVLGTLRLGEAAARGGCRTFILISTDKAVNPSSIMGASKRVAELVIQCLDGKHPTRYVAVRFGNVLGSTGSVIPTFKEQIRRGGPITVTHPDMTRYFMTIPEAAQLVLQAGAIGRGGEIFILDMGEPVRIVDVARDMVRLSGLRPDEDIQIRYTGVRPGEKLFEELATTEDRVEKTRHPKIFIGRIPKMDLDSVQQGVRSLVDVAQAGDPERIRRAFLELVPEAAFGPEVGENGRSAEKACQSSAQPQATSPARGETHDCAAEATAGGRASAR